MRDEAIMNIKEFHEKLTTISSDIAYAQGSINSLENISRNNNLRKLTFSDVSDSLFDARENLSYLINELFKELKS